MLTSSTVPRLPSAYLHENTGSKLVAVATAIIPLEIAFVGLRYYSRFMHKTAIGLDDILVAPALLFCLALNVSGIGQFKAFH